MPQIRITVWEQFTDRNSEGKTGVMELTSSKTTIKNTTFDITYGFSGQYQNSGKYILDLINSIYVISK
jgi:hypothetical protein